MPTNVSSSGFWINFENNFVVLEDAEHVIGVDEGNRSELILENLKSGSKVQFGERKSNDNFISTLVYDQESRSLYSGDFKGHLFQHKVDTSNLTCEEVKNFGDLGIESICSSARFMQFVFFGGSKGKVRVLDLSTGELLPGHIQTSIKYILSLQVCVKSATEIFLAVSGVNSDYSDDKTDLFDLSGLLRNDPATLRKFASEYLNNETFTNQQSFIESKADEIRKLTKEKDFYKEKFTEMQSKYNYLKEKYNNILKEKEEMIKSYNTLKTETEIKTRHFVKKIKIMYQHKSTRTTIGAFGPIIDNKLSEETNHKVIISKLLKDIQEKKKLIKYHQKTTYEAVNLCKAAEEKAERLEESLQAVERQFQEIRDAVGQR